MVQLAVTDPQIGLVSAYNATETRLRLVGLPLAQSVFDGVDVAKRQLAGDAYVFAAPTTVMMRADLVRRRNPFYDEECLIAEDMDACYRLLSDCRFGFVHQVLTFVRTENESILSKIRAFDAQALDRVVMLKRHGATFFAPSALQSVWQRTLDRYYAGLAVGTLCRHGERFWRFHRDGLASVGLRIDRARLAMSVARELASCLAHPVRAYRRYVRP